VLLRGVFAGAVRYWRFGSLAVSAMIARSITVNR
jgi:hypothetical protein